MTKPEVRFNNDFTSEGNTITGYAAVFDSMSRDLGGFREIIKPGAFRNVLSNDVRALINHDKNLVIGRSTAGTLKLIEDSRGLRVEIDLPDTSYARDLQESMRRKDITGMSFRFYMHEDFKRGQKWNRSADGVVREITEFAAIDDVSMVAYPAYTDASATLRSYEQQIPPNKLLIAERRLNLELKYFLN